MFSTDRYLGRRYRLTTYNCAHFAVDVWRDLTGIDIGPWLAGILPETGTPSIKAMRQFERINKPVDPCLVLYTDPVKKARPHAGVWIKGKVLHLCEQTGVQYVPVELAAPGLTPRYYRCRP